MRKLKILKESRGNRLSAMLQDVYRMITKNDGLLLTGIFGEEKYIKGRLESTDFLDGESIILGYDSTENAKY